MKPFFKEEDFDLDSVYEEGTGYATNMYHLKQAAAQQANAKLEREGELIYLRDRSDISGDTWTTHRPTERHTFIHEAVIIKPKGSEE